MNYIQHLNAFFWHLQKDHALRAPQISLYMALFHCWNCCRFAEAFLLDRDKLMQMSGIGSKATYAKCLKKLHLCGYIIYQPSAHRYHKPKVSLVTWRKPDPTPVPGMGSLMVRIDRLSGSQVDHFNKQITDNVNGGVNALPQSNPEKRSVKETQTSAPRAAATPPVWDHVKAWFLEAGYPEIEAFRFFHHHKASNWRQSNGLPITDWQSAALKWNTNTLTSKTNPYASTKSNHASGHLHVQQHKDYSNPL